MDPVAPKDLAIGSPLHYAAAQNHMDALRLLLEANADQNAREPGPQGYTPLLLAAQSGQVAKIFKTYSFFFCPQVKLGER